MRMGCDDSRIQEATLQHDSGSPWFAWDQGTLRRSAELPPRVNAADGDDLNAWLFRKFPDYDASCCWITRSAVSSNLRTNPVPLDEALQRPNTRRSRQESSRALLASDPEMDRGKSEPSSKFRMAQSLHSIEPMPNRSNQR
jgi:hypothetical protein